MGTSTQVTWYSAPSANATLGPAKGSFITTNNLANLLDTNDNLGLSSYTADGVASASYDEVRFWNGTLDSTMLQLIHAAGPDADLNSLPVGGRLPSTTALNLTGSTATLDLNGLAQTVASLSGVAGSSVLLDGGTLTFGTSGTPATFSGTVSGPGSLIKTGSGTTTLDGANSFSGDTFINAGTLQINSISAYMHHISGGEH